MDTFNIVTVLCVGGFLAIFAFIVQFFIFGLLIGITYLLTPSGNVSQWQSETGIWILTAISYLVFIPLIYFNFNHSVFPKADDLSTVIIAFMIGSQLSTYFMLKIFKKGIVK